MKEGFVYILQSEKTHRYYIGSCQDITARVAEHNAGQTTATKYQRPWVLKFKQFYSSIVTARRIEYKLKKLKRRDYIENIIKDGRIKIK
ncbi:MAG: GIY-YIG nuclease family protein [Patescibacteria group bacterium]